MLHESLVRGAAEFGDAPCIVEAETGRALTYAQCLAGVHAMRRLLGTDGPHAVVMVLSGGMVSALTWLATLTGGHTLLPLPPDAKSTERDRAQRLQPSAQPDVLLVEQREDAESFSRPFARVITREECEAAVEEALAQLPHSAPLLPPAEGQVCLMTSGSTGEPKGVFLTEAQIAWTADAIRQSHRLTAADRGLTVLPLFHVNAPVVSLCSSLLAGGSVVIARRFSRTRFWGWIEHYGVTWASIVPTILAMLLETERPAFLPGKLRFVRTASAPLPVVHLLAFERRFRIPVVETYGLSEAAATVSATPVPPGVRKPGSVGLPVGVELRICRQRANTSECEPLVDVARGETGEVCVRGPSVIAGYAGGAGATSFQDGWFRTGDLGYQDADGYLYINGRLRDVIIRGGENVAPREIEEVMLADPGLRDVAVVGQPDPLYGQQVVAYIVPKGRWTPEREEALRAYCSEHLSKFKIPETFIPVRILPRTRSGKIQRHRLAAMASGSLRASVAASVSAGVTQTVARLRQVTRPITRPVKRAVASSSPRLYVARATPTGERGPGQSLAQVAIRPASAEQDGAARAVNNGHNGHNGHNGYQARPAAGAVASTNAPPAGKRARRPYIHELDPIRVVTALSVVGVHVLTFSMVLNATVGSQDVQVGIGSFLHFTREIFMFTTAFVLVYSYAGSKFDIKTFARKRGIGVVVPYVLWSLIYLVLNRHGLSPVQFTEATVKALISGDAQYQLYYILLTIQFYLIFPLLLLVLPWMRKHQRLVLGASCALELVVLGVDYAFVQTQPFASTSLGTFLNNYQDRVVLMYQFYFVLGAIAALHIDRVRAFLLRWGNVIAVALVATLALFWLNFELGVWWLNQNIYYATSVLQPELVPYSLVVLAFLGWLACRWALGRGTGGKPRAARFWRTLADASFGIYLVHPLFISFALTFIAPALPSSLPVALRVIVLWGVAAVGASAMSVGLMKTPLLSRLVGRPSALPSWAALRARFTGEGRRVLASGAGSPDPYSTAPLAVVARPATPTRTPATAGRGFMITVTASSARHERPKPTAPGQHPSRLVGMGTVDGWMPSEALAPGDAHRDAPRGAPDFGPLGAATSLATSATMGGASTQAPRAPAATANRHGQEIGQDGRGGAELAASVPGGNRLERGPDSRERREARRRRALTLRHEGWQRKDIAAALGVSRSTVSYWFRQEFLREREEGTHQDDLLETNADDADGQTHDSLRDSFPSSFRGNGKRAPDARLPRVESRYEPRTGPRPEPRSRPPSDPAAERVGRVERASVTANR